MRATKTSIFSSLVFLFHLEYQNLLQVLMIVVQKELLDEFDIFL